MALTRDTYKDTSSDPTYTCGAGTTLLVVFLNGSGSGPSSVTYNGVAMTRVYGVTSPDAGSAPPAQFIYTLANPATGSSHSIAWSWGTGSGNAVAAVSYKGAAGIFFSGSGDYGQGANPSGTSSSLSTTPDFSNSWIIAFGYDAAGGTELPSNFTNLVQTASQAFLSDTNGSAGGGLFSSTLSVPSAHFYGWGILIVTATQAYTLTAATGSFTLTGIAATLLNGHNYVMTAATGSFTLTGFPATITWVRQLITQVKNITTLTNRPKN